MHVAISGGWLAAAIREVVFDLGERVVRVLLVDRVGLFSSRNRIERVIRRRGLFLGAAGGKQEQECTEREGLHHTPSGRAP